MSSISMAAPSRQPTIKGSAHNATTKTIHATHSPDDRKFDVIPLLHAVEDVLTFSDQEHSKKVENNDEADAVFESLIIIIDQVGNEINSKYTGGTDAHAISILKLLSNYSWDVKLVIALAAFAMNYGEFLLVVRSYNSNQQAKSVAILKEMTHILERPNTRLEEIKKLIEVMLHIADCVVKFKELPFKYMNETAIHVYWTIRSILACASHIDGLIAMGQEQIASTAEASWEISSLSLKLRNMHSELEEKFKTNHKIIEEEKYQKTFKDLSDLFNKTLDNQSDNINVLKALICAKDDLQPLIKGTDYKRVSIDELREKYVLLLISDLDILVEEIIILEDIYNGSNSQESKYEIVWLPIIDPAVSSSNDDMKNKFKKVRDGMTWYSVDPSLIDQGVIKFIKQEWHFGKKSMLVVLGQQGQVACPNAFHMMLIWGSLASPFTTSREKDLWSKESWRLELLVGSSDPIVDNWMNEGKYICLYGGEDIEWIRKFIKEARAVAQAAGICLEMVYVGKRNPKGRVQRIMDTITTEKLSHCLQDPTAVWYFWVRIESMWRSKNQLKATPENDPIMKEILTILTFDSMEDGWAIFGKGSDPEMVKAKGNMILKCLENYNDWKDQIIQQNDFMPKLKDQLQMISKNEEYHCNRLMLPTANGVPEAIACVVCLKAMDKFTLFRCCN